MHPDYIMLRPSVTTNVNPKLANVDASDESSDDEDTPVEPKVNFPEINSKKTITLSDTKKLDDNLLTEPTVNTEPPFIRKQPTRACENNAIGIKR